MLYTVRNNTFHEERRAEQQVQKITDEHKKSIDDLLNVKEAEIMEV